jgi:hypothetical protein
VIAIVEHVAILFDLALMAVVLGCMGVAIVAMLFITLGARK